MNGKVMAEYIANQQRDRITDTVGTALLKSGIIQRLSQKGIDLLADKLMDTTDDSDIDAVVNDYLCSNEFVNQVLSLVHVTADKGVTISAKTADETFKKIIKCLYLYKKLNPSVTTITSDRLYQMVGPACVDIGKKLKDIGVFNTSVHAGEYVIIDKNLTDEFNKLEDEANGEVE